MSFARNSVRLISALGAAVLLGACATTTPPGPTPEEQAATRASQARSAWLDERDRAILALRTNPHLSVTELQHDEAVIRIRSGGLFRSASNNLTSAVEPVIDHIAQTLVAHPLLKIEVIGHTDNLGKPERNLALSLARAQAVHDALVSAGVDSTRASFSGRGDAEPIAPNDTREGRAVNRRVDLLIAPFSYTQGYSDDASDERVTDPAEARPQ